MKTDLMIPITVFEKNEVGAIRELLGNDVTINGYVKNVRKDILNYAERPSIQILNYLTKE